MTNKNEKMPMALKMLIGLYVVVTFTAIFGTNPEFNDAVNLIFFGTPIIYTLGALYFWPAIIAKDTPERTGVLAVNLFFGWTGLIWVIALIWAYSVKNRMEAR